MSPIKVMEARESRRPTKPYSIRSWPSSLASKLCSLKRNNRNSGSIRLPHRERAIVMPPAGRGRLTHNPACTALPQRAIKCAGLGTNPAQTLLCSGGGKIRADGGEDGRDALARSRDQGDGTESDQRSN